MKKVIIIFAGGKPFFFFSREEVGLYILQLIFFPFIIVESVVDACHVTSSSGECQGLLSSHESSDEQQ